MSGLAVVSWPALPARKPRLDHGVLASRGRQRDRAPHPRDILWSLGRVAKPPTRRGLARLCIARRGPRRGTARSRRGGQRARIVARAHPSRPCDDHPRLPGCDRRDVHAVIERDPRSAIPAPGGCRGRPDLPAAADRLPVGGPRPPSSVPPPPPCPSRIPPAPPP